jgi:lysophospholipase L1-like esterase
LLIRRILERFGLVIFGLAMGLLLVEAGLRIAAFVTSRHYALEDAEASTGRVRILSLGDSNTFGFYVGRSAAYPQLLESRWNALPEHRAIQVINAGYPGNTSWSVLDQLGERFATYRPEIVTVMVGANDAWRKSESAGLVSADACMGRARGVAAPAAPTVAPWRLMRLWQLLESRLPVPVEVVGEPQRGREQFDPAWTSALVESLQRIAACAAGAGAQVVFLTYPSSAFPYTIANDAMRMAAIHAGVPLIDLGQRLAPSCPSSKCEYLFPDQHPTRAGHAWIADMLVNAFPTVVPLLARRPGAPDARPR